MLYNKYGTKFNDGRCFVCSESLNHIDLMNEDECCLTGKLFLGGDTPLHFICTDDGDDHPICAEVWKVFLQENSSPQGDDEPTVLVRSYATPDEVARRVSARFIRTRAGRWPKAVAFVSHWQKCRDEAIATEVIERSRHLDAYVKGRVPAYDETE